MNAIKQIKVLPNFRIWVKFEDGFENEVDIKPFIGEGFTEELLNFSEFEKVEIESGGGLVWENGFDICPVFLREYIEHKEEVS